jgi:hypothetical protein
MELLFPRFHSSYTLRKRRYDHLHTLSLFKFILVVLNYVIIWKLLVYEFLLGI